MMDEQNANIEEIPIFPLNMVVFPGTPVPLHIFEERYKEMVNECLTEERPFGIVLIEQGKAEGDPNVTPHLIGCTVQIAQVQRLEDGRMFIMTFGLERFRLLKLDRFKRSFLTGKVEYLNINDQIEEKEEKTKSLQNLIINYLSILQEVGEIDLDVTQLPTDTEALIYVGASLLSIDNGKKQSILQSNHLSKLMDYLLAVYRKELKLLQMLPKNDWGAFSVN